MLFECHSNLLARVTNAAVVIVCYSSAAAAATAYNVRVTFV